MLYTSCNETEQISLFVCACTSGLLECSWEHSRTWPSSVRSPFPSLLRLHDPWTTRRSPSPPPEFLYLPHSLLDLEITPHSWIHPFFNNAQQYACFTFLCIFQRIFFQIFISAIRDNLTEESKSIKTALKSSHLRLGLDDMVQIYKSQYFGWWYNSDNDMNNIKKSLTAKNTHNRCLYLETSE